MWPCLRPIRLSRWRASLLAISPTARVFVADKRHRPSTLMWLKRLTKKHYSTPISKPLTIAVWWKNTCHKRLSTWWKAKKATWNSPTKKTHTCWISCSNCATTRPNASTLPKFRLQERWPLCLAAVTELVPTQPKCWPNEVQRCIVSRVAATA